MLLVFFCRCVVDRAGEGGLRDRCVVSQVPQPARQLQSTVQATGRSHQRHQTQNRTSQGQLLLFHFFEQIQGNKRIFMLSVKVNFAVYYKKLRIIS